MHQTLYRKYRPSTFEEVAGEKEIVTTLKNSLRNNTLSHAYLFTGPRGVGKTTSARLIAKGVNCLTNGVTDTPCNTCDHCISIGKGNFPDMIEIDAASNRGIDEIRKLKDKVNYNPVRGRKKIYIIDEVHMLTREAFNGLLKTLEEPPKHVIFILATTEPEKILDTIISRCQRFDFKLLSEKEVSDKLEEICKVEGYEIEVDALKVLYDKSGGSMRDSLSILEKLLLSAEEKKITLEITEKTLGITSKDILDRFQEIVDSLSREKGVEFLEDLWLHSHDIELFFKDYASYIKEKMVVGTIDLKIGFKTIDIIYDLLTRFRVEENKKLLGYIILNRIITTSEPVEVVTKEVVKVVEKKVVEKVKEESKEEKVDEEVEVKGESLDIGIDEIKESWNDFVERAKSKKMPLISFLVEARPYKIEDGIFYISFPEENSFAKDSIEEKRYNEPLCEAFTEIYNGKIRIEGVLLGSKGEERSKKSDEPSFADKVAEFFQGEIV